MASLTWSTLETLTGRIINDTANVFHTQAVVRRNLEYAELFLAMARTFAEATGNLALSSGVPIYSIHSTFADFIMPLRVTINDVQLRRTNLASLGRFKDTWFTSAGTPDSYFMVGATLLGFYPTPNASMTAKVTYLRVPPTGVGGGSSPVIDSSFHEIMPHYASAILFAVEGDIERATEEMQLFLRMAGLERDFRFMPGAETRPADRASDAPVKQLDG
jgi:hypothetical protein